MNVTQDGRLTTGIDVLDRRLGGGIPPGHVVALTAPPDTQSELLLSGLADERDTRYLTTVRSRDEVVSDLPTAWFADTELEVIESRPDRLLADPDRYLADLPAGANLIVDTANGLEAADREEYLRFLDAVKTGIREVGGAAIFHCTEEPRAPPQRGLTLNRADLTWRLRLEVDDLRVSTRLVVSKFRGGRALLEPIKLKLTDTVDVDTSRDIG
ncbi:MAG: RAD55 family ATPase [Salinigranum sp.]